jgi:hypothetical protein
MEKYIITFLQPHELPTMRDAFEISFPYFLVEEKYLGTPEEKSETKKHYIKVGITGRMDASWRAKDKNFNLLKVLYEYGKRHIIQKLKDHTLQRDEELIVLSTTHPDNCPFESDKIIGPNSNPITIEIPDIPIMRNEEFTELAALIIDTRDNINTLFHKLHNAKLFFIDQERDLLQLFRNAQTPEEFIFRVTALRNIITNINDKILLGIVQDNQNDNKSINLFERYLKIEFANSYEDTVIKTYRHINRLRMSYPIHSDQVHGIIDALKYFGLVYPIDDFTKAWKTILTYYKKSLETLLELFKKKVFI